MASPLASHSCTELFHSSKCGCAYLKALAFAGRLTGKNFYNITQAAINI